MYRYNIITLNKIKEKNLSLPNRGNVNINRINMIKLGNQSPGIPLRLPRLEQMLGQEMLDLSFIIKGNTFHSKTPVFNPRRDRSSPRITQILASRSRESPQVKKAGGFNITWVRRANSVMSSKRVKSPYSSSRICCVIVYYISLKNWHSSGIFDWSKLKFLTQNYIRAKSRESQIIFLTMAIPPAIVIQFDCISSINPTNRTTKECLIHHTLLTERDVYKQTQTNHTRKCIS